MNAEPNASFLGGPIAPRVRETTPLAGIDSSRNPGIFLLPVIIAIPPMVSGCGSGEIEVMPAGGNDHVELEAKAGELIAKAEMQLSGSSSDAVNSLFHAAPSQISASVTDANPELRQGSFSFDDPALGQLGVNGVGTCTATLVDPEAIVTAAHCVNYTSGTVQGTFRIDLSTSASRTFAILEARSFGSGVGNDDVAVVRLASAVPSGVAIPIKLSWGAVISMGQQPVTMYGYGCRSGSRDAYSGHKQRFDTNFSDKLYGCPGDSGGPIITTNRKPGDPDTVGYRTVSVVFSGWREYWWFGWHTVPEYGVVHTIAPDIADQYDMWAGRPPGSSGIVYPRPGGEQLDNSPRKEK